MSGPTEAQTRHNIIDPALRKAGWDVRDPNQVGIEIPVDGFDPAAWQALEAKLRKLKDTGVPYDAKTPSGITNYALYRENGFKTHVSKEPCIHHIYSHDIDMSNQHRFYTARPKGEFRCPV